MHETFQFNTTTAAKQAVYKNISAIVQSMRDVSPNSGAYFVRRSLLFFLDVGSDTVFRTRETSTKPTTLVIFTSYDTHMHILISLFTDSYWGDNYPRLLSLKHKYDPHSLLDCWQCGMSNVLRKYSWIV